MADDLGRKAVAGVAGAGVRRHAAWLPGPLSHRKPDSQQLDGTRRWFNNPLNPDGRYAKSDRGGGG